MHEDLCPFGIYFMCTDDGQERGLILRYMGWPLLADSVFAIYFAPLASLQTDAAFQRLLFVNHVFH